MIELLLKEEVYATIRAAIEVHRELGPGFVEPVYQEAMQIELALRSVPFEYQKDLDVIYKGIKLRQKYRADLITHGQIIVELKALKRLSTIEEAQLLNYLKVTKLRVGLLVNFGSTGRLEWKRMVF